MYKNRHTLVDQGAANGQVYLFLTIATGSVRSQSIDKTDYQTKVCKPNEMLRKEHASETPQISV